MERKDFLTIWIQKLVQLNVHLITVRSIFYHYNGIKKKLNALSQRKKPRPVQLTSKKTFNRADSTGPSFITYTFCHFSYFHRYVVRRGYNRRCSQTMGPPSVQGQVAYESHSDDLSNDSFSGSYDYLILKQKIWIGFYSMLCMISMHNNRINSVFSSLWDARTN